MATRRLSATSDLSSLKSVKYTPTRPTSRVNTAPPPSICRNSIEPCATFPVPVATAGPAFGQPIPSAVAYREHHEQDKYDAIIGTRDGSSLPAVVTPSPTPVSPRLRNSRQRQPLQPSQGPSTRSPGTGGQHDYLSSANASGVKKETRKKHDQLSSTHISIRQCITDSSLNCDEVNPSCSSSPVQRLSLQTSTSSDPPPLDLPSASTDFNESPVLVNTGTASMTSPAVRHEPQEKLPMPTVYQRSIQDIPTPSLGIQSSEGSVTESIPVMLSNEVSSQHQTLALEQFGELLQPVSYCDMQPNAAPYECHDSSTRPYFTRKKHPLCSAHSTPDVISNSLALHQDIHDVLESVLSQYRHMQMISPEFALRSKERVQRVSPVAVQHSEWASKEATETFLARMLHDSNEILSGSTKPQSISAVPENLLVSHCPQESSHLTPALEGTSVVCSQPRQCLPHSGPSPATSIQENASQSNNSLSNVSQNTMTSNSISYQPSSPTTSFNLPHSALDHGAHGFAGPSIPPDDMPSCVQPPRPTYSPPPPPPPSQPSTEHQQAASSSPPPSLQASTIDNKFNMHPARARTPTFSTLEQSLQNTNGSQILKAAHMVSPEVEVFPISQIDTTQQALVKRYRILEELLTTEHQFCIDMMIAHNIFEATAQNLMTEKEKKLLFSNCKDLEKFSLSLFRAFKKASKPIVDYEIPPPTGPWNRDSSDKRPFKTVESYLPRRNSTDDTEDQYANCTPENDRLTTIGQVFLDNKDKMERLYTTYFLNQENASLYIKKNQNNCDLSGWVIACFEQVQNMTQAWDLDSLLLKPCQRLLKYPLLLESLANASDPNHPDLMNIRNARKELLAINARINDAKARSDTFRAAASEGKKERSKGKGIGKTFVKAFIPKPDKNKAYDEADKAFKDQEYKSREQKFGGHFFQLQIVIRDFEQYLDAITEHYLQLNVVFLGFITVCEVAPSICPEIESTWRTWAMAHFELQNKALEQHKVAVRNRVLKPVGDLWEMWVSYQKTIEQRKKYLLYYVKYKQMIARGEKVDLELEDLAQKFIAINETLKHELPLLYERTKVLMRILMTLFMCLQKDWYKTCSKKILPLLESEPQHTTSLRYDLDSYVERFEADYKPMQNLVHRLGIINRSLLADISIMTSPTPTMSDEAGGSSRNSSSRRTASIGSDVFPYDPRPRNNGGGHVTRLQSRNVDNLPRSSPIGPAYPSLYQVGPTGRSGPGPTSLREARALGPVSDNRDATAIHCIDEHVVTSSPHEGYCVTDGVVDLVDRSPLGPGTFDFPPQLGASFLSTTLPTRSHNILETSPQRPGSLRTSRIFNSALPMSDSPIRGSTEDLLTTPPETEEPEVLFLAASLFEFNIAHDRREGGIPYLVYVPGEIFDVIGMKGELWLARNQDDSTKTIGWIWEKHFARILPEDA